MAELADAPASGAGWGNSVQVRFLLSALPWKGSVYVVLSLFVIHLFLKNNKTILLADYILNRGCTPCLQHRLI